MSIFEALASAGAKGYRLKCRSGPRRVSYRSLSLKAPVKDALQATAGSGRTVPDGATDALEARQAEARRILEAAAMPLPLMGVTIVAPEGNDGFLEAFGKVKAEFESEAQAYQELVPVHAPVVFGAWEAELRRIHGESGSLETFEEWFTGGKKSRRKALARAIPNVKTAKKWALELEEVDLGDEQRIIAEFVSDSLSVMGEEIAEVSEATIRKVLGKTIKRESAEKIRRLVKRAQGTWKVLSAMPEQELACEGMARTIGTLEAVAEWMEAHVGLSPDSASLLEVESAIGEIVDTLKLGADAEEQEAA